MALGREAKMKRSRAVVVGVVLLLGSAGAAVAATVTSLRGLESFDVVVEEIPDLSGLEEQIKTDVELKLRLAGIKVDDGQIEPYLYVNVNAIEIERDFVFSISLGLVQEVTTDRFWSGLATTWDRGTVGFNFGSTRAEVKTSLRESVKDLVDQFLNDYLTANPRTPTGGSTP
jgi:hypothetical protein